MITTCSSALCIMIFKSIKSPSTSFSRLYQVWLKQLSGSVKNYENNDAVDTRRQLHVGKLGNILLSLFISSSQATISESGSENLTHKITIISETDASILKRGGGSI